MTSTSLSPNTQGTRGARCTMVSPRTSTTTDPMPMLMQQSQTEPLRRPRRPRGVLAFLGQQESVTHYPYDSDAWKTPKPIPTRSRSTRRSRRNRNRQQPTNTTTTALHDESDHVGNDGVNGDQNDQAHAISTESRRLVDICEGYPVIILFLFDPQQPHSFQIRNQLVRLCATVAQSDQVHCLCATTNNSSADELADVEVFLRDTGFSQFTVTAAVQTCFHWTRSPYLTVVGRTTTATQNNMNNGNYSRKVISTAHEELALTWNANEVSVERWLAGQSALSCQQQFLAVGIFPSCNIL
jgi:hypothetical protein